MALDPNEYTVRELRGDDSPLDGLDADELEAALELEREGKERKTAIAQLEAAIDDAGVPEPVDVPDEEVDEEAEDGPLEDLYPAPEATATTPVIFDTMGAGGGTTGHNTIHRIDADGEAACGARVGQKGQRGPRARFDAGADDCGGCWG